MFRSFLYLLCGLLLVGCEAVTPSHDIPVRQEYVEAGIAIGDTVEITKTDGETVTVEVTDIGLNTIETADETYEFADIERIVKRSWQAPDHPCGNNEPVGCSIPEVVLMIEEYSQQASKFHPACVTHDFCYRHGFATYGDNREACDEIFLADMKKTCGSLGPLSFMDAKNFSMCRVAAEQTYNAVRLKGEKHFRTTTSTYCEFRLESQ